MARSGFAQDRRLGDVCRDRGLLGQFISVEHHRHPLAWCNYSIGWPGISDSLAAAGHRVYSATLIQRMIDQGRSR